MRPVRVLWLLTFLFCVALAAGFPWLRGDVPWMAPQEQWVWPYELPRLPWLLPCLLGLVLYVIGAAALLRQASAHNPRFPLRLLLWAFGGAALLPLLLMTLEGRPLFLLFTRSASPLTGGFQYATAMSVSLTDTLWDWTGFVLRYREEIPLGGIALSPPGLVAAYHAFRQVFEASPALAAAFAALLRPLECQSPQLMRWDDAQMASAWFQMFMPLWAALGVAPLYRLGSTLYDRERARLAVVLWPLVPGLAIFIPRFNVFYALMAVVMLVALWRGLSRDRPRWIFLSGFIISSAIFMNLSTVPLGLLGGLLILSYRFEAAAWRLGRPGVWFGPLARDLLVFGVGSASVWAVYWLLSGVSPFDVIRLGLSLHYILERPYLPWVFMHTYDMFLFVGLPLAALALWRMWRLRHRWQQGKQPGTLFAGAAALTLIILVLSGTGRGETGRVWLFFAPVWILLAADMLAAFRQRERAQVLAMQALVVLCMAAVLRANFTTYTAPPFPPAADRAPTFTTNVQFRRGTDAVTLVGLSVDVRPAEIALHLHWRADAWVRRVYILSLVTLPPDGSFRESLNWIPYDWNYPPSCWLPGHEWIETVSVPLGAEAPPGDWLFSLALSDVDTAEPMRVTGPDGGEASQFGIGPVKVPPP